MYYTFSSSPHTLGTGHPNEDDGGIYSQISINCRVPDSRDLQPMVSKHNTGLKRKYTLVTKLRLSMQIESWLAQSSKKQSIKNKHKKLSIKNKQR